MKTLRGPGLMTVLALAAAQPLAAQQPEHRLITVTGESEVRVVPDEVVLTLGVQTSDHDLGIAKAENDRRVAAVLAAAEQHGVEREHLRTDYLQIEPRYRDRYEGVDFLGYWVQKTIVVRLSEIGEFENLLTAVLEAGANFVHGIDFRTTELRQHRDRARALALQAAAEKAEAMAAELDMELGRPRSIREDHFGWWSSYGAWWGRRAAGTMSQNVVQNIGSMPTQLEGPTTPGQL
ncbi:MAG: SIMPL domain-containing protein, partial [Gemmatimonadales bacterium]